MIQTTLDKEANEWLRKDTGPKQNEILIVGDYNSANKSEKQKIRKPTE